MQSVSVKTVLRTDRQKNGLLPIYIRVIVDRKKIDVRVAHYVAEGDLQANGSVRPGVFNSWAINQDIQDTLTAVNKVVLHHRMNNLVLTPASFSEHFHRRAEHQLLYKFIRAQADRMSISKVRLYAYRALANLLQKHHPKLNLADCSFSKITELERFFCKTMKYNKNTVSTKLSMLRAMLNVALKNKLIKENPFSYYRIKGQVSTRNFLTKEDVLLIEKFHAETHNIYEKNVAAIFLFLCYTGMRVGDFTALTTDNIIDNCIEIVQQKTKAKAIIPLCEPALRFINTEGFTFYKVCPKQINLTLKSIQQQTGIQKVLTCHVARHTFATLSLQLKIDIATISKILGHSKITTTMIYAKVLDDTKKLEMQKWNSFLGF